MAPCTSNMLEWQWGQVEKESKNTVRKGVRCADSREIVSLHIGQCGCQLGNAAWEMYCAEHAITCEGQAFEPPREGENVDVFFSFTGSGQYVPRSIYIDLEATVIGKLTEFFFM
ncbi:hypothetical protein SprV_0200930100 [Sparganum proliferum]